MDVQTSLQFTHLLAVPINPLRNNIIKSPAHNNNNNNNNNNRSGRLVFACTQHSTTTAPRRKKDAKRRVVITGMGLVSVFGNDVDMFYQRLLDGESGIGLIDRFDASKLLTQFAGQIREFNSKGYIGAKYDLRLDNSQRYCIVAGKKALENAALGCDERVKIDKERAGVVIGSVTGGATVYDDGIENLIKRGYTKISPYVVPVMLTSMGSALLSIDLGFTGPTYGISGASASSNLCLCTAANHIREGKADLMLAGGADAPITPMKFASFGACRVMSRRNHDPKTACRPWDINRDGCIIGEGAGVLVMESLEHAMKRDAPILAEYLGGAVNFDAYHITNPQVEGVGLANCIHNCLVDACGSVEEVNYINAHAPSTMLGDMAELRAINKIFKKTTRIKMNATKSMIGHAAGAAGSIEAIATIKAIQTGWLHPTINQFDLEPEVLFDTVANQKKQHEIEVAISNTFGLGGHNSVVAFSAFKP